MQRARHLLVLLAVVLVHAVHTRAEAWATAGTRFSESDEAVLALAHAERRAALLVVDDRIPEALESLTSAIRAAAAELAARDAAGRDGAELADEIEYAIVRLEQFGFATFDRRLVGRLLAGVAIDPRHGAAFASLDRHRDARALGTLSQFEIVGPFDNERGAAFARALPVASDPSAASYRGKVRDVAWRVLPDGRAPRGVLDLGALVEPSAQVAVLARTWVSAPAPGAYLLHLGAEEEVRVWHDGVLVFEALGEHEFAYDAHAVPLDLASGWNELCVLVGSRDRAPRFVARLALADGDTPVELVHTASAPEGTPPRELGNDTATLRVSTPQGARARWADVDTAEGALRRSVLALHHRPVARHEHPGRADGARAVELAPDDPVAHVQHTWVLLERGSSNEKDVNPWLHAVDALLAVAPNSAYGWRQRANHAGQNQQAPRTAFEHIERALAGNPNSVPALSAKLEFLRESGTNVEFVELCHALLALPDAELFPSVLRQARNVLPPSDPRRLAIARAVFEATEGGFDAGTLEWAERFGAARVDEAAILAVFERERAFEPWNTYVHLTAARDLFGIGAHAASARLVDEALAIAPERAALHSWRARLALARGDTEAAVAALERAVEFDFAAEDERRLLEHLRTSGAEPFHVRYQEPLDDVLARHPLPVEGAAGAEATSREVVLHRVAIDVEPDGTAKTYRRLVQRVLTESGVRELDRLPFRAGPYQEVRVLTANVVRADGTVVPARTGRSSWGMVVDLPPLAIGDVVDVEWRVDDTQPTFFGNYFGANESLVPDFSVPTHESDLVLRAPAELPLVTHVRGSDATPVETALEDGRTELRWRTGGFAPVAPEPLMPPAQEFAPLVQATSYPSWEAFGAWWWKLIEHEITTSPPMSAKVAELVAGKASKLDQLRAIYEFVVTDIRYNAWEFGVRGYQPYSAPVIFSRGFGDCKDKSILMRAMLSEVGIECWPVLVYADERRYEEDHTLALVEHFNHCIAYVPAQDGIPEMFLDGTARHHPFGSLPTMDDGAKVLVVKADGVVQMVVPRSTADENRTHSEYEIVFTSPTDATVTATRRSFGRFDPADRGTYTGSEQERDEALARLLSTVLGPLADGARGTFSDLEDLGDPVVITATCRPTQLARATDTGFELPVALSRLDLLQSLAAQPERRTDLLLDVPMSATTHLRYTLPPGAVGGEPPPPVELSCEDARYSWSAQRTADGYSVVETFVLVSARIPAERYSSFRDFARAVDAAQAREFEVESKP
jgi:tetratricopeptide (TPR) repeat protein